MIEKDRSLVNAKTDNGLSAVIAAVYHGRKDIAQLLVSRRAEPNVFQASAIGKVETVHELIHKDPLLVNSFAKQSMALHPYISQPSLGTLKSPSYSFKIKRM